MRTRVHLILLCILLVGIRAGAQDIESKLAGSSGNQGFTVKNSAGSILFTVRGDGRIGIGTAGPDVPLHVLGRAVVDADDGVLFKGIHGSGSIPAVGEGTRFMFYPMKSALRSGFAAGDCWNPNNVGVYSTAMGYNTIASGDQSTAFGDNTKAGGTNATALGQSTTANGLSSTAMGEYSTASGPRSTAAGYYASAGGQNSVAMGWYAEAGGNNSLALGDHAAAPGEGSVSIGSNTRASGDYSTAIGYYANTNGKLGSMVLSDASTTAKCNANADYTFRARFAGGYYLFSNSTSTIGVMLAAGSNSWSTVSDSTKKEAFAPSDGEHVLSHFPSLRLGSWSYRADAGSDRRHYGPIAQEWHAAFGRDGIGCIGSDTLLSSADVDGIAYAAIQALERRTRELKEMTEVLFRKNQEIVTLREELKEIRRAVVRLNALHTGYDTLGSLDNSGGSPASPGR